MKLYLPVLLVGFVLSFLGFDAWQIVIGQLAIVIGCEISDFIRLPRRRPA